jgi:hypothetical protein
VTRLDRHSKRIEACEHDNVSLKDYFDQILLERDQRNAAEIKAIREAVDKAEHANDRRLDLLNEFRAQATDEGRKYLQRVEYQQSHDTVVNDLGSLNKQVARLYGGLAVIAILGVTNFVRLFFH